jgi:nickel/cobalt transporter (NiCoT) family protein
MLPTPSGPSAADRARLADLRLTRREVLKMGLLYGALAMATLVGFLIAFRLGEQYVALAGLGIICYILGLRHGFDADHIAAIDNTTRKLLNDGKRPLTVGTWFSLGHSTVVCGLIVGLVAVYDYVASHVATFESVGNIIGTLVSGVFLVLIGLVNLIIVAGVYAMFQAAKRGRMSEAEYEDQLNKRGLLYRYFHRLFSIVKEPWQIYPIGILFGLGFDTATEVALVFLTVTAATVGGVPVWTALILPFMFTCGMVLSDTSDGFSMRYAYGWAFNNPIRKIFYNLTLTVISVMVAFVIGGVELLQILARELGLTAPFWRWLVGLNFETLGIAIVALFLISWAVAMVIYRVKHYEQLGFGGGPGPPATSAGPNSDRLGGS